MSGLKTETHATQKYTDRCTDINTVTCTVGQARGAAQVRDRRAQFSQCARVIISSNIRSTEPHILYDLYWRACIPADRTHRQCSADRHTESTAYMYMLG